MRTVAILLLMAFGWSAPTPGSGFISSPPKRLGARNSAALCSPRLRRSLGAPFRVEPWWNGSVTSRGNGNLASCVYLVDGERASCDVQVVLVRGPGAAYAYAPNLIRNLAAPEQWRVARMEAILPNEKKAGLPGRVNLLQEEPEPKRGARENRRKGDRRDRRSFFRKRWRGLKGWFERSRGRAKPSDDGR